MVLDLPDEAPKFTQAKYVADVPENSIDYFVAQVQVGRETLSQRNGGIIISDFDRLLIKTFKPA